MNIKTDEAGRPIIPLLHCPERIGLHEPHTWWYDDGEAEGWRQCIGSSLPPQFRTKAKITEITEPGFSW